MGDEYITNFKKIIFIYLIVPFLSIILLVLLFLVSKYINIPGFPGGDICSENAICLIVPYLLILVSVFSISIGLIHIGIILLFRSIGIKIIGIILILLAISPLVYLYLVHNRSELIYPTGTKDIDIANRLVYLSSDASFLYQNEGSFENYCNDGIINEKRNDYYNGIGEEALQQILRLKGANNQEEADINCIVSNGNLLVYTSLVDLEEIYWCFSINKQQNLITHGRFEQLSQECKAEDIRDLYKQE